MKNTATTPPSNPVNPIFAVGLWIALGYCMIIFNKLVLSTWKFSYPCFLTGWHCLLSTILTQVLSYTTNLLPGVKERKITTQLYLKRVFPIAFLFSISLTLGNTAYQYISLGYIQMIKAITPVPLLLIYFFSGRETPSVLQLLIVCVICSGVIISSVGELLFSWTGFLLQMGAVCAECIRLFNMDALLKDTSIDSLSMLYYTAPISVVFLSCGFVIFEADSIPLEIFTPGFCGILFLNGLFAFSLNLAAVFLISNTSGMILSVAGPLKDIMVIITSATAFGSPVTPIQIFGFSLTLIGLYFYQKFKREPAEMQRQFQSYLPVFFKQPSLIEKLNHHSSEDLSIEEQSQSLLLTDRLSSSGRHLSDKV